MVRYKGVDYDSLCKHMTHLIFFSIEVAQDGSLAAMDRCSVYSVQRIVYSVQCIVYSDLPHKSATRRLPHRMDRCQRPTPNPTP
jgi:hypothetical protein